MAKRKGIETILNKLKETIDEPFIIELSIDKDRGIRIRRMKVYYNDEDDEETIKNKLQIEEDVSEFKRMFG